MKKISIIITSVVFCSQSICSQDILTWRNGYEISWSDFKDTPNTKMHYAAVSSTTICFNLSYDIKGYEVDVEAIFDRSLSWTKAKGLDANADSFLLLHERGHFNINELFARKLRKQLLELAINYDSILLIRELYHHILSEKRDYTKKYDLDTDWSKNPKAQLKWSEDILRQIKQLENYSETRVKAVFK